MKKYLYISTLIFAIIVIAVYLLWPITSAVYDIVWDKKLITNKKQFLELQQVDNSKKEYPNILLIIVDDLGKTDISLYGEGKVNTPHIEKLGRQGVIFNQAYVTSPVCSPSRAAILIGRYPQRYGFTYQMQEFYPHNRLMHYGFKYFVDTYPWEARELEPVPDKSSIFKQGVPPSEILLSELLKKEGYITALIGKWHLGQHAMQQPRELGFDYQYGFYASHSLYAPEGTEGIVDQRIPDDFTDRHIWSGKRKGAHAIYRNGEAIEEKQYLTDAITRECISFLENNKDTTFFLVASYNAPHTPLQAPENYVTMFVKEEDPVKRVYYAMIKSLDDNLGRLLKSLQSMDLEKNTLVFFISDNGGASYTGATDNAPLKGGKISDFEGGVNVPMILRWPRFGENKLYQHPVSAMDIFATITSQLDIRLPGDRVYDGVDLIPYLFGTKKELIPHQYLYWNRGDTRAIRSATHKLVYNIHFGDTLLYDMTNDNLERQNIYQEEKDQALELINHYDIWYDQLQDPLWPPLVYYIFDDGNHRYYFDN